MLTDECLQLCKAATALIAATDGMENLRPEREAVLDAMLKLAKASRSLPISEESSE